LPCALLATHGKEIFAVQQLTAKLGCTAAPDFPVVYWHGILPSVGPITPCGANWIMSAY
jgi:hypothetical protein